MYTKAQEDNIEDQKKLEEQKEEKLQQKFMENLNLNKEEQNQRDIEIDDLNYQHMCKITEINNKFERQLNEIKQVFNLEKEKYETTT